MMVRAQDAVSTAAVMAGMNNGERAGVWAPYVYTLKEKGDSGVLCSGADAGAFIPSMIVANKDYAAAHPKNVARFVAVYLRAWNWIRKHPVEAREEMKKFYAVALDLASDVRVPAVTGAAARQIYSIARAAGQGHEDWTAILNTLGKLAR